MYLKGMIPDEIPEITYVVHRDGTPLMPTRRKQMVRRALKNGKAGIISLVPFTIQMREECGKRTQPLAAGIDPGRSNIGISVVNTETKQEVFRAEVSTRNKEIVKLMADRKAHRMASRRGERKRRQRRAKKADTMIKAGMIMRKLPGYEQEIMCKAIRNTEARFSHRRRPAGWLTPSASHLLLTHLNLLRKISRFLPIQDVCLEVNRFAFMELEDPSVTGLDFQNGPLKGFDDKEEAAYALQKGRCLLCGKKSIDHYHHIRPKSDGGSDTLGNIAGLCSKCHEKVHKDQDAKSRLLKKKEGLAKKYGGTSVLNQVIPFLTQKLQEQYGDRFHPVEGWQTCEERQDMGIIKDRKKNPCHGTDAFIIACIGTGINPGEISMTGTCHQVRQFRKKDRARINARKERAYYTASDKAGKPALAAKNRKPRTGQADTKNKIPALSEWYRKRCLEVGKKQTQQERSQMKAVPSARRYNNPDRLMPGAEYLYKGKRYIMQGQMNRGNYIYPVGQPGQTVPVKQCKIINKNSGLVFTG